MTGFIFPKLSLIVGIVTLSSVFGLDIRQCSKALGMESGRIKDNQISASSSFDEQSTGPQNSRLNSESGSGAWCPFHQINETSHEFLQIEFPEDIVVSGIETQGRFDKGRGMEFPTGYMVEYWRTSLGRWARYKDSEGNEIIEGNSDTRSPILRIFDGAIIGKIFRIIPVSEVTRTVCLRVELHGCTFRSHVSSYSAPVGSRFDGLDLRDLNYDGDEFDKKKLKNGIGKIFDGITGEDNFEKHPGAWVGWNKNELDTVILEFLFTERRNFSSIFIHTSNFRKHGAGLFSEAKIYFSTSDDDLYSQRIITFEQIPDLVFESSRWVRIFVNYRIAKKIRIELNFGDDSEWLLISEVKFESTSPKGLLETEDDSFFIQNRSINVVSFPVERHSNFFTFSMIILGIILAGILWLVFRLNSRISKSQSPLPMKITPNPYPQYYEYKKCLSSSTVSTKRYVGTPEFEEAYAHPDIENPMDYGNKKCFNSSTVSTKRYVGTPEFEEAYAHPDFENLMNGQIYNVPEDEYSPVEIRRADLEFVQNLGSGKFGTVDIYKFEGKLVAVKSLKSDSPSVESEFKKEINIMSQLRHQNIVRVIGITVDSKPILCISEFLENGDLKNFLSRTEQIPSQEKLLSMGTQIAAGMAYLESRKFIHRDLAARNCFLDSDGTVKIGDFGMARSLYGSDYYKIDGQFELPIRWMAPESVFEGRFSHKTDTWALGVTLWELYSICREKPFSNLTDNQVIHNLQNFVEKNSLQEYLSRPSLCPQVLYSEILFPCWKKESERPTLTSVHRFLQILQFSSSVNPRPPPPNRAAPEPPL